MNRILLATDGSPSARGAADQAIELARDTGAALQIVTVWSPPKQVFGYGVVVPIAQNGEAERQYAENVAEAAADAARAEGLDPKTTVRRGDPTSEICARATVIGADLIVIGSHGRGPLTRTVLGSVSTRVLQHAPCPVLVVRGDTAGALERRTHEETAAVR